MPLDNSVGEVYNNIRCTMLELVYEENIQKIGKVWNRIFTESVPSEGMFVLLRLDEVAIGVAHLRMPNTKEVVLCRLGIYEDLRGRGFGDFFLRSLFYMLTLCGNDFVVESTHPYFAKFGFVKEGERMRVHAENLVFPSQCGGH